MYLDSPTALILKQVGYHFTVGADWLAHAIWLVHAVWLVLTICYPFISFFFYGFFNLVGAFDLFSHDFYAFIKTFFHFLALVAFFSWYLIKLIRSPIKSSLLIFMALISPSLLVFAYLHSLYQPFFALLHGLHHLLLIIFMASICFSLSCSSLQFSQLTVNTRKCMQCCCSDHSWKKHVLLHRITLGTKIISLEKLPVPSLTLCLSQPPADSCLHACLLPTADRAACIG